MSVGNDRGSNPSASAERILIGAAVELIDVGGRTIAYHRVGDGPPLLLLHGGWSDGRSWRPQLAGLSDGFDVIAWDAPGCGGSDDPDDPMALADYADAVADLIAALSLERVHVCGLSFGGGLAIAVYQRHPTLVRSLVLVSAYAGWKGSLPPAEVDARLRRARAELDQPPAQWCDSYLPGFFANPVAPEAVELIRTMMLEIHPAGQLAMLTAFAAADLREVLPTITVPTLVMCGDADVRAPLPVAQALHEGIPGSELVVLPGAGHHIDLEAPEVFNAEVRRFLRTVA